MTNLQMKISAKALGELALPGFCPRCFWVKLHHKLPYQIFPGVFSAIDSYSKHLIHAHFHEKRGLPLWMRQFGECIHPITVPHHSRFYVDDDTTGIRLCGTPDEIIEVKGGHWILDYKTSRFTGAQDELLALYEVQLRAYSYVFTKMGMGKIVGIALVYFEPQTTVGAEGVETVISENGFLMPFSVKVVDLPLEAEVTIPSLLRKCRQIFDLNEPPQPRDGCKDCRLMDSLMRHISSNSMSSMAFSVN